MRVTLEEIDSKRTKNGGWTKKQLSEWGVPWPPPHGWKRALAQNLQLDLMLEHREHYRDLAREFSCPECGARRSKPCRSRKGRERQANHEARYDLYLQYVRRVDA